MNHTYCQVSNLNAYTGGLVYGSSSVTASTVSAVYIKNSCDPFHLFEIKDRQLQNKIESIINPALYCQTLLSGQSPFFYYVYAGVSQASEYCADVFTYRDPRYYFPPVSTANNQTYDQDPTPTAMPILTPENGAGTSPVMSQIVETAIVYIVSLTLLFPNFWKFLILFPNFWKWCGNTILHD